MTKIKDRKVNNPKTAVFRFNEIFSQISNFTPSQNVPRTIVGTGGILKDAKKLAKSRLNLYFFTVRSR